MTSIPPASQYSIDQNTPSKVADREFKRQQAALNSKLFSSVRTTDVGYLLARDKFQRITTKGE